MQYKLGSIKKCWNEKICSDVTVYICHRWYFALTPSGSILTAKKKQLQKIKIVSLSFFFSFYKSLLISLHECIFPICCCFFVVSYTILLLFFGWICFTFGPFKMSTPMNYANMHVFDATYKSIYTCLFVTLSWASQCRFRLRQIHFHKMLQF